MFITTKNIQNALTLAVMQEATLEASLKGFKFYQKFTKRYSQVVKELDRVRTEKNVWLNLYTVVCLERESFAVNKGQQ